MISFRTLFQVPRFGVSYYSTQANSIPPMLLKIRGDMKKAMQAKDTNRLNVLRGLLAQTLNASKTSNPITTDMQVLALLKRTATQSRAASAEFRAAGRSDLADKEETQVHILEEYAGDVQVVGVDEILRVVEGVVDSMRNAGERVAMGDVLKRVFSPEIFGSKVVDRGEVAKIVKRIMSS